MLFDLNTVPWGKIDRPYFEEQKQNFDRYITIDYLRPYSVPCLVAESVYETGSIFNPQRKIYCVQMRFNCAFAYPQPERNHFICISMADESCDLSLAIRQLTRMLNNAFPIRPRHDTVQDVCFNLERHIIIAFP